MRALGPAPPGQAILYRRSLSMCTSVGGAIGSSRPWKQGWCSSFACAYSRAMKRLIVYSTGPRTSPSVRSLVYLPVGTAHLVRVDVRGARYTLLPRRPEHHGAQ